MVQVNLRTELYKEAVRRNLDIPEWLNRIAKEDLFPDQKKAN